MVYKLVFYVCSYCDDRYDVKGDALEHEAQCTAQSSADVVNDMFNELTKDPQFNVGIEIDEGVPEGKRKRYEAYPSDEDDPNFELIASSTGRSNGGGGGRRQHRKEKVKYTCATCDKSFSRRKFYDNHLLTHQDVTSLVCPECPSEGVSFPSHQAYIAHMKAHRGENNNCNKCDESFSTMGNLRRHVNQHHRRVKCDHCSEKFADQTEKDCHEKEVHASLRPFKCRFCADKFATATTMENHERRLHGRLASLLGKTLV